MTSEHAYKTARIILQWQDGRTKYRLVRSGTGVGVNDPIRNTIECCCSRNAMGDEIWVESFNQETALRIFMSQLPEPGDRCLFLLGADFARKEVPCPKDPSPQE